MSTQKKQPTIAKGKTFTGWATFNWGICHRRVFRTRREAIDSLLKTHQSKEHDETWKQMSKYMRVVKIKCIVI